MPKVATMAQTLVREVTRLSQSLPRERTTQDKELIGALQKLRGQIDRLLKGESGFGSDTITLGRSDGIARYFAFCFVGRPKQLLDEITAQKFQGSGVYAIYYHGKELPTYLPISESETPIYVGKADPQDAFADNAEEQGPTLPNRIKEHFRSISRGSNLDPSDFQYRAAVVQSGMQYAVEEFIIRLFRPIWNKQVGVCHGIGKHGDSATTRSNKRSPWDTMHPGRNWAKATKNDQRDKAEIESRIAAHFSEHPIIPDKSALLMNLGI
jgi:hypothetical protein